MSTIRDPQVVEFDQICRQLTSSEEGHRHPSSGRVRELDNAIDRLGPWWLGHFLVESDDEVAKTALTRYMREHWPQEANTIDEMITAVHWRQAGQGNERDFGSA